MTKKSVMTVALFGLGKAGFSNGLDRLRKNPASHFHSIKKCPQMELVAVIDTYVNGLDLLTKEGYTGKFFRSLEEFLTSSDEVDLIVIATPSSTHKYIATEIIRKKNPICIFCEKPGGQTLEELEEIVDLAKKRNIHLGINYFRRWDSTFASIVSDVQKNLKTLKKIVCFYNNGLENYAVHIIDLLIWITPDWKLEYTDGCKNNPTFILVNSHGLQAEILGFPASLKYDLFSVHLFFPDQVIQLDSGGRRYQLLETKDDLYYTGYSSLQHTKESLVTLSGFEPIYEEISNCLNSSNFSSFYSINDALSNLTLIDQIKNCEFNP
tara:strand:+ start:9028 stop:9996 length:969 start_codon:yes stop_codon:yes gene_type:complete